MIPLVTIGIPCYNSERWLAASVESALAQTWPAREVIVADDGSTDRSLEILHEFGNAIEVIGGSHLGANHARNEILRRANGEWIQYLDSDDYLMPEKIARQLDDAGTSDSSDLIYGPVLIEQDGIRVPSELDRQLDLYSQWLSWQLPQTGGCLWRRDSLRNFGGWNESMPCCQEHELYLRALKAGARFGFASTPNAVYRVWSDETLCRRDPIQLISIRTRLIDDLREWMIKQGVWTEGHRRIAGRTCFEMARTYARFDLAAARKYHKDRRKKNLIHLEGPAAPGSYKLAYNSVGFAGAERLASALR